MNTSEGSAGDVATPWIGSHHREAAVDPVRPPAFFFSTSSVKHRPHSARRFQGGRPSISHRFRVVVVDDHPVMLDVVKRLLDSIPGVEVVGDAASGHDALEIVARLRPNLVVMDLSMPGMDGLEATRRLTAHPEAPTVIIMTVQDLPQYRNAARAAGALGFIGKSDLSVHLEPVILQLLSKDDTIGDATEESA